jgi:hypothetical protein
VFYFNFAGLLTLLQLPNDVVLPDSIAVLDDEPEPLDIDERFDFD